MSSKVDVLDHGFVRIVDSMGDDLSVVRAARVSYDAAWRAGENEGSDHRLIHYLWRNKHTTPFEAVEFQFEVKAPIFVFRQWHRHRTWCLAGDTPLIFNRPVDGRAFRMRLSEVVRKWTPPSPKRQRYEKTLTEFNRERLHGMGLRAPGGTVNITDAWFSGEKPIYRLKTKYGEVCCSSDHLFKTPDGQARLGDNPRRVMALARVGPERTHDPVVFSEQEKTAERWVEIADGYEVSDLGRVRSYWGQGRHRAKQAAPFLKVITLNKAGRAVVNIRGRAEQVSQLVFSAFVGPNNGVQVLHGDDNPMNNRVRNLRAGTPADNMADQYENGGRVRLREVPADVLFIERAGVADTFDISVTGDRWFCAGGLVVHNSFNELSARYRPLPEAFYVPDPAIIGEQSKTNKQGRQVSSRERDAEVEMLRDTCAEAFKVYRVLLEHGWPRELARSVLPVATYSHMFAKVNLRNLLHFLTLRCDSHAQYEIRVYAEAMRDLIRPIVPVCLAAWEAGS